MLSAVAARPRSPGWLGARARDESDPDEAGISLERSDVNRSELGELRGVLLDLSARQHAFVVGEEERHQEELYGRGRQLPRIHVSERAIDEMLPEDAFLRPSARHRSSLEAPA